MTTRSFLPSAVLWSPVAHQTRYTTCVVAASLSTQKQQQSSKEGFVQSASLTRQSLQDSWGHLLGSKKCTFCHLASLVSASLLVQAAPRANLVSSTAFADCCVRPGLCHALPSNKRFCCTVEEHLLTAPVPVLSNPSSISPCSVVMALSWLASKSASLLTLSPDPCNGTVSPPQDVPVSCCQVRFGQLRDLRLPGFCPCA